MNRQHGDDEIVRAVLAQIELEPFQALPPSPRPRKHPGWPPASL